ncbi:hypothetical protein AB0M41_20275 [Streptomyces sp. NPDC051896]|uniref:hypothetical protein n=1 Tax=Streptomyces sp. NPDC051896 TaxID=3155416 RepID=UPI003413D926
MSDSPRHARPRAVQGGAESLAAGSRSGSPCALGYALTERLAPAERAAIAMTVLCAGGPLATAAGQAASAASRRLTA